MQPRSIIRTKGFIAFLPAAAVLALWIGLIPGAGGFFARDWLPAGLGLAGLWAAVVVGSGRIVDGGRTVGFALGALGALTLLCFASMLWASSPGTAWLDADLFLMNVLAVSVLTAAPWKLISADALFAAFAVGVALTCGIELLSAAAATDLTGRFLEDRWAEPLGYPNGTAGLAAMGALPALVLSARPDRAWWVKAPAGAVAAFLACVALLPQSRGAVIGGAVAIAAALALVPFRWRLVVRVAILGLALWAASGPIFAVYDAATAGQRIGPELDRAVRAMFLAAAGAGLAVLAVSLVESRIRLGERGVRLARLSGVALLAVLVLGVGVVGAAKSEGISNTVHDQWNAMLHPGGAFPGEDQGSQESSGSRLLSTNPVQRYDYWRVALDGFRDHPVAGLGAGGFDDRYEADRRYPKHSAYPHNVALRALSELGLLGGLLTLAFVAAVGWGLLRGLAGSSPGERGLVAAGVAAAAYFLVHGEFDWIEAFPVMMGPALALPLVALVARERPSGAGGLRRPRLPGPVIGLVALAAVAAAASFALPWLAVRYRERAVETWRANAPAAFADLERAARLDRLNAAPLLVEGSIALQLGDDARAVASFEEAARREPSWLAHFELGLIAGARGDKRAAMRQLEAAKRLNPPEPAISAAQAVIRRGRNVDPVGLSRRLFESPLFNLRRLT